MSFTRHMGKRIIILFIFVATFNCSAAELQRYTFETIPWGATRGEIVKKTGWDIGNYNTEQYGKLEITSFQIASPTLSIFLKLYPNDFMRRLVDSIMTESFAFVNNKLGFYAKKYHVGENDAGIDNCNRYMKSLVEKYGNPDRETEDKKTYIWDASAKTKDKTIVMKYSTNPNPINASEYTVIFEIQYRNRSYQKAMSDAIKERDKSLIKEW